MLGRKAVGVVTSAATLFLGGFISLSVGQPVIDHTVSPIVGDIDSGCIADTTNWNPGASGANVVWDFSSLVFTKSGRVVYISPASTPYGGSFPAANIAYDQGGAFGYFDAENGGYYSLGSASNFGPKVVYTDIQTVVTYPFTYGDSLRDTAKGTYDITTVAMGYTIVNTGIRTIYSKTSADGYGTLKVPGKEYANALRLKIVSTAIDSLTVTVNGGSPTKRVAIDDYTEYYWVISGTRLWAMYMDSVYSHQTGNTTKSTMVTYYLGITSTVPRSLQSIVADAPRISCLQNGFYCVLPRTLNPAPCSFELFNLAGTRVLRSSVPQGTAVTFLRPMLPAGLYCYRLLSGARIIGNNRILVK
jgi:hypothetical protein